MITMIEAIAAQYGLAVNVTTGPGFVRADHGRLGVDMPTDATHEQIDAAMKLLSEAVKNG